MEWKTLLVTFKGFLLKKIKPPFLKGESPTLRKNTDFCFMKEAQSNEKN